MSAKDEPDGRDARAERLAQALRENLKRRKAQARSRRAPRDADAGDSDAETQPSPRPDES